MKDKQTRRKIGRPAAVPGEKPTGEKILQAAIDLFAEKGYDGTPVRSIAQRTGITEAAVYRHFPNKESILAAVMKVAEDGLYTPLPGEDSFGLPDGPSLFYGLLMPLVELISSSPTTIKISRIVHGESMRNDTVRHFYQEQLVRRADDYTEALVRRAVRAGTVRRCDTRALARMLNAYRSDWSYRAFVLDPNGLHDQKASRRELANQIRFFEELFLVQDSHTTNKEEL